MCKTTEPNWHPAKPSPKWELFGRCLALPCYPFVLPWAILSRCNATAENAKWWSRGFIALGLTFGTVAHSALARKTSTLPLRTKILSHLGVLFTLDHTYMWLAWISHQLVDIMSLDRSSNRLKSGNLHGPNIIIIGNGPSALEGDQRGSEIDEFDEVVRFNNFQTKVAGLEKWVGTKSTVHFSDGVLYPTYEEYSVPGASVVLSLFQDRFIVAGSYVIMRAAENMQTRLTIDFLKDPQVGWIEKDAIERLKKNLGLTGVKHPTSGMLAIDHFLRVPGVKLPIYIHGFDFFMGPKMHYYDEHEPAWERFNNHIGVNMHSPHKEKLYVEKLIAEGKVCFLKDRKR